MKKLWKKIKNWFRKLFGKNRKSDGQSSSSSSSSSSKKLKLVWCYGGVDANNAKEDTSSSGYKINSASLSGDTLRFSGSGSMWGCDHPHPDARNCLFFKEGDTYYGGFFEWGSSDRVTRQINNIKDRYKGWDYARLMRASEFAFCLTDKGCSRRSNIVTFKK